MKINKITIGRLYNLGNYEHIRYDLTVELKDDESAATAVLGLEKILAGLKPDKYIKSEIELEREAAKIERMKKMTAEEWDNEHRYSQGSREEITRRYEAALEEEKRKRAETIARGEKARELFDDLGGASQWKDAKMEWEEGY
jgi:hypothetical protein